MNIPAIMLTGLIAGVIVVTLTCFAGPIPAAVFFAVFVGFLFKHTLSPTK